MALLFRLMLVFLTTCCGFALPSSLAAHNLEGLAEQFEGMTPEDVAAMQAEQEAFSPEKLHAIQRAESLTGADADAILEEFGLQKGASEQLFLKTALWPQRHQIRACFMDGPVEAKQHVRQLFTDILKLTNLTLGPDQQCGVGPTDVQISFATKKACYSYLGRQSRARIQKYPNLPTIGLCDLTGPQWSDAADGTIRHELMHALGAIHEHQHPEGQCVNEFDLNYMQQAHLFDEDPVKNLQKIFNNIEIITKSYSVEEIAMLPYDPKSIMHYQLNPQYFLLKDKSPCYLRYENTELSDADKSFLRRLYPM